MAKCYRCGAELEIFTDVLFEDEKGEARSHPAQETRRVTIVHRRDFHHPKGYVWEEWSAVICTPCDQQIADFIGHTTPMEHWVD